MRAGFIFLFILIVQGAYAQTAPVEWKASVIQVTDQQYRITLEGKIKDGWHVYADDNREVGLESVRLNFKSGNIKLVAEAKSTATRQAYKDPLFDHQQIAVYKRDVEINYVVKGTGAMPAQLPVVLSGFVSNDQQFLPLQENLVLNWPGGSADFHPPFPIASMVPVVQATKSLNPKSSTIMKSLLNLPGNKVNPC